MLISAKKSRVSLTSFTLIYLPCSLPIHSVKNNVSLYYCKPSQILPPRTRRSSINCTVNHSLLALPSHSFALRLSNLFNVIPRKSALRLPVYKTLLQIATSKDEIQALQISRPDVEIWLSEWDISPEEKSEFLKFLVDAFVQSGQKQVIQVPDQVLQLTKNRLREISYEYTLSYVRSLPLSSPCAKTAAVEAITIALRSPVVFDFGPLFNLDAVIASKDHPLFSLLQVFLNDDLVAFNSWVNNHSGVLEQYSELLCLPTSVAKTTFRLGENTTRAENSPPHTGITGFP